MAKSQFTVRISDELLNKLTYIAEKNSRSPNKEFEQLIKQDIFEFEQKYGTINLNTESEWFLCHQIFQDIIFVQIKSFYEN